MNTNIIWYGYIHIEWCYVVICTRTCTTGLCDITSLTIFNFSSRSTKVVTASDCQCQCRNSPGFDPSILLHSREENEAVLNKVLKKSPFEIFDLKVCVKHRAVDPDSLNPDPPGSRSGSRVLMTK